MRAALLALLLASALLADNPACHAQQGAIQRNVSVPSNTAVSLNAYVNQVNIHVCSVTFSLPEANAITWQASDGTVLAGPEPAVNVGLHQIYWDGQISTVGGGAALGSSFQIKFGTAPSTPVGVTIVYYLSN